MTSIALFGAGGKMGTRLARNLIGHIRAFSIFAAILATKRDQHT
ncbi:hypothetical protein [Rhizobium sp. Leaf371]|nr:hypothetical protein [Rhizobium sp. Leaf371]